MAKKKKTDGPVRDKVLNLRLTEEEMELVVKLAAADDDRPVGTWARIQLMKTVRAMVDPEK